MYLGVIFQLLITLAITRILIKITEFVGELWVEKAASTESKLDDQLVPFLKDAVKVSIVIFALLIVLGMVFKVNVSALIGGLGIGGLAIALAAQESLANLLGSFTIFLDKPFTVGDVIDFNGIVGTVEKVGFRSTRIRTLDKSYVTVPNKSLVGAPLNNITESTHRRSRFFIGVLYSTPPDVLKNIISEIYDVLLIHEQTNDDPLVRFFEYGDSSLNILVTYLVNTNDYNIYCEVREEINYKIYEIVLRNGSDFAFPTRTVHVQQEALAMPAATPAK
jgi:MscS family membrane protein